MAKVKTGKTSFSTPFQYGKFRMGGKFKSSGKSKDKGLKGLHRGMKVTGGKKSFGRKPGGRKSR